MRNQAIFAVFLIVSRCVYGEVNIKTHERSEAVYYANAYADHYKLPRSLVYAVIEQESGWNPLAVSEKGAIGIMQLMPATAQQYGVRHPFVVSENIGAGTRYLSELVAQFHGDFRLAIAAYYCGNRPIMRSGLNYSNQDVFRYVSNVRRLYFRDLSRHEKSTNNNLNERR